MPGVLFRADCICEFMFVRRMPMNGREITQAMSILYTRVPDDFHQSVNDWHLDDQGGGR
ncbi:MAG: hypothetical protein ACLR5X_10120 [Oscillospiraceae bacterium]